jgi:colanic acid/amylovoran biosynthesis glycosyltransferase
MVSMVWIVHEIQRLRQLGFEIQVASINAPDAPLAKMTPAEQEESHHTYYIKKHGISGAIQAHFYTLLTRPFSYFRGLWFAISLGKFDLKKMLYGFFYFIEAIMVGEWLRRQQLSHLHIHLGTSGATVGMIAMRTFPITYSITVHGPQDFYDVQGYYLTQKVHYAKFICCISHYTRSQLMAFSPPTQWHKLEVSRLGVNSQFFTPRPFRQQPATFEILCVGRLVPVKGQYLLIAAVEQLLAQGYSLRLRLVGDGCERERLEHAVKASVNNNQENQGVIFEGAINQEQLLKLYQQTDIFVLPSFAEGLPVVLMEAMAMEIPCVTTHITGIPELIENGKQGILVAPSDQEALITALALLMDKPQLRHQLGIAAKAKVLHQYDLEKNTAKLAALFQKYLS